MKYAIIYDSVSGNTKQIANCIYDALPKKECIFFNRCDDLHENLNCDLIFIGSWCDKGTISDKMKKILPFIKSYKVALFGTCGFGGDSSYFEKISNTMKMVLPSSCIPLKRTFICQGKMPLSVRARYEQMLENSNTKIQAQHMIQNFDSATSHPDEEDLHNAKTFAIDCYEEVVHGNKNTDSNIK